MAANNRNIDLLFLHSIWNLDSQKKNQMFSVIDTDCATDKRLNILTHAIFSVNNGPSIIAVCVLKRNLLVINFLAEVIQTVYELSSGHYIKKKINRNVCNNMEHRSIVLLFDPKESQIVNATKAFEYQDKI